MALTVAQLARGDKTGPIVPMADGSVRSGLTSWPFVQTVCNQLGVSFQQAQGKLANRGYFVGPTDRLPWQVVVEALQDEGFEREHLRKV